MQQRDKEKAARRELGGPNQCDQLGGDHEQDTTRASEIQAETVDLGALFDRREAEARAMVSLNGVHIGEVVGRAAGQFEGVMADAKSLGWITSSRAAAKAILEECAHRSRSAP